MDLSGSLLMEWITARVQAGRFLAASSKREFITCVARKAALENTYCFYTRIQDLQSCLLTEAWKAGLFLINAHLDKGSKVEVCGADWR